MRNRTAVRLLYVLAVLAGLLPPILFLGYAFRQSVVQVDRDLDFIGTGTVVRAENVIDAVSSTLRKVASLAQDGVDESTVSTLRQAVFLNRFIQALRIRDGTRILCSSEDGLNPGLTLLGDEATPIPPVGQFDIHPPTSKTVSGSFVTVAFAFSETGVVEGLVDPSVFNEFFDYYAHESGTHVFVYFGGDDLLTSFGKPNVSIPANVDRSKLRVIQWTDNGVVRVANSLKYPISTVTVAPAASVTSKWARTAIEFAIAGMAVAALLATLVIRVVRRTRSMESDLREAVHYRELEVHYQPIVDLNSGRCIGAEALMRWKHPQRGMIPAGEFISIAEKTDLILPMTELLLVKVADDLEDALDADASLHIGINLAPQHFASHKIIDSIQHTLSGRIRPEQVIYEITERGLVGEEDSPAASVMKGLTKTGGKLAVDDFGTGYSSLSYLQKFRLDFLKIDKAFVDGISDAESSSGLVDQIIRIAKSLNMRIIAEGVEEEYQAVYLRKHGVEFAQGWHFGRPMPADRFLAFVETCNGVAGQSPAKPTTAS